MGPQWYEKLFDLARAIFTLRHGVISAMTIIVVSAFAAIVLVGWLTGSTLFGFLLCFVFLVGAGAVVLLAIKAPELSDRQGFLPKYVWDWIYEQTKSSPTEEGKS